MKRNNVHQTSFGKFIFGAGNEVALMSGGDLFTGLLTSKGVENCKEVGKRRISKERETEICEMMTKAHREVIGK